MRRVAKLLLVAVLGSGAAAVLLVLALGAAMAWSIRTRTDLDDYSELRAGWPPALVAHFPREVPENATSASVSFFPGFLQGGAWLQLHLELPGGEIGRIERALEPRALRIYDGGGFYTHHNVREPGTVEYPTTVLRRGERSDDFPAHYRLYLLAADPTGSPTFQWNHGMTRGVAISRKARTVVYWLDRW